MNIDDLLQARISLLESGESLDTCLQGVPAEVAVLIKLADTMRHVDWPQIDPSIAASQRTRLMKLGQSLKSAHTEEPMKPNQPDPKPFWKRWDGVSLTLAAGAFLVLCAFLALSIGGFWLFSQRNMQTARNAPPSSHSPEEAALLDYKGYVEILADENWIPASEFNHPLTAGMQIRTGSLSSATLQLYDGSKVLLGPDAELGLQQLDARTEGGPRTVVLTQPAGTSEHEVASAQAENSLYEVRTAAASGTALGTVFKVKVNADQSAWFSVLEGEVSVSGNDQTVLVEAGETTLTSPDAPPAEPDFFLNGSGEVSYSDGTWVIAGQVFTSHAGTVVTGSPLTGDLVYFEGRLLADNTRLVDLIVLLRRSPANVFSLRGTVETIGDPVWLVNGQEIVVTDITAGKDGIAEGDLVLVEGIILPDGTLQAEEIRKLEDLPGLPFKFNGIVEDHTPPDWIISGVTVQTNAETLVDEALAQGDLVQVSGWMLEDGTWLAESILRLVDETRSFEFSGLVDSLEPWSVAGVEFETREWTHIDEAIEISDLVRVSGQILEDGTWVAYEITRLVEPEALQFILVGQVTSLEPWIVSGYQLEVDAETRISEEITLGMLVRVEIQILPDGAWKILSIQPVEGFNWELGCRDIVGQLASLTDGSIQLEGWPEIPLSAQAAPAGEMTPGSILQLQICFNEDGSAQVIYIFVLFQPPDDEIEEPENPELPNEKVMICHTPNGKNPHTIVVSRSAVPAHLGHGDVLGTCASAKVKGPKKP